MGFSFSFSFIQTHQQRQTEKDIMPPNMQKRILNEIAEANNDKTAETIVYVPHEDDICKEYIIITIRDVPSIKSKSCVLVDKMIGSIQGPRETPYEGKL